MPRYFTIEQARATLPAVGRSIREAVQAKSKYDEAEAALQALSQRIMFAGGMIVDTTAADAWKTQRESNARALKSSMERLEEIGAVVKDLEIGLVDFPTLLRGEEVLLCWRMDEDDIEHWHGVHEGFAGRKAIDRDFLENHRGEALS
jgi:hypothetical protein